MTRPKCACIAKKNIVLDLALRSFYIYTLLGIILSFAGLMLCIMVNGVSHIATVLSIINLIAIVGMTYYGYYTKKTDYTLMIISCITNFLTLPFLFFATGGLFSTIPMFFILGLFIITPIASMYNKVVLFISQVLFYLFILRLGYALPAVNVIRDPAAHTFSLTISLLIVSIYLFSSTVIMFKYFRQERSKVLELNNLLKNQANYDSLTGLYNRRYLTQILEQKMAGPNRHFSGVLIDLDNFKKLNDTCGHTCGDDALIILASAMQEHLNGNNFCARFGGEEFLIYFDTDDLETIRTTLHKIRRTYQKSCMEQLNKSITFSGGLAIPVANSTIVSLFNEADNYLYQAKAAGKNRIFYKDELFL